MARFVHQGFLQRFPYKGIDLSKHRIAFDRCAWFLDYKELAALSDASGKRIRTIHVSELDGKVETMEDWRRLAERLRHVHSVVLLDDRSIVDNAIVKAYADRTLRVYIQLFLLESKECLYAQIAS
ncbi:MAG: hypothetical protein ACI4WT_09980 [Oligosphaeraceae bacterium]